MRCVLGIHLEHRRLGECSSRMFVSLRPDHGDWKVQTSFVCSVRMLLYGFWENVSCRAQFLFSCLKCVTSLRKLHYHLAVYARAYSTCELLVLFAQIYELSCSKRMCAKANTLCRFSVSVLRKHMLLRLLTMNLLQSCMLLIQISNRAL